LNEGRKICTGKASIPELPISTGIHQKLHDERRLKRTDTLRIPTLCPFSLRAVLRFIKLMQAMAG
jgi:hypothetical protein